METPKKIQVYVLVQDDGIVSYDVFTDIDARHYVQFLKKGDDKYTTKHGTLRELVGEYEYGEGKRIVQLLNREIEL